MFRSHRRNHAERTIWIYLLIPALATALLEGPAFGSHELEHEVVPEQYILSLNLTALGTAWAEGQNPRALVAFCGKVANELVTGLAARPGPPQPEAGADARQEGLEITPGERQDGPENRRAAPEEFPSVARPNRERPYRTPRERNDLLLLARTCGSKVFRRLTKDPGAPLSNARLDRGKGDPHERPTSVLLHLEDRESRGLAIAIERVSRLLTSQDGAAAAAVTAPLLVLQPNYIVFATQKPNDPLFPGQWALTRSRVPEAWETKTGKKEVVVAVVDSGFDHRHKELGGNLWPGSGTSPGPGRAFCEGNPGQSGLATCGLEDPTGHGTAMAGIIGAGTNDGLRVAGTNWEVGLMILKALGASNRGSVWDVGQAIRFAAGNGARIISLSLGGRVDQENSRGDLLNAIFEASGAGALVVAAAGNENLDLTQEGHGFYPASFKRTNPCRPDGWACDNLLVVGATDRRPEDPKRDRRAPFSNYGPGVVDLGAPGVAILTTGLEGNLGVAEVTGTSAAAALVAGAAALVASALPACDPSAELCYEKIKQRLLDGADRVCDLRSSFSDGRQLNICCAVAADESGTCPDRCSPLRPSC